jgi:ATP-dependent helicase/nuclease subunit B
LPSLPIETLAVADAGFWTVVADAVLQLREQAGGEAVSDLRGIDVVVPNWAHAPFMRAALHARLKRSGHLRCIPPRIYTLAAWAGDQADDTIERRIELFTTLRASDWIRSAFGAQPAALWSLAAHVAALCDELTLAAVDGADSFEDRLQASLARHFFRRAARAVQPQAQLILQLWRAGIAQGSAISAHLAALQARGHSATRPLVFVSNRPMPRWTTAWLSLLADRVPVHVIRADVAGAVKRRPLFAAAWPELCGSNSETPPIAMRAQALDMVSAADGPTLIEAHSLEDEALAVANQVMQWLRNRDTEGPAGVVPGAIALVALDRIAARRVRALLERAQVLVRDETGWKLSTTSAAGAVMRLFDLALNGFSHRDLLDWLKSPFTLHGEPGKSWIVQAIERAIRDRAPAQGLAGLLQMFADPERPPLNPADRATAERWLRQLQAQAGRLSTSTAPVAARARALDEALGTLGMRAGLAADPVGKEVLRELDGLHARFVANRSIGSIRLAPAEFRTLIAARFEEIPFAGDAVDSPVVMISLSAAALRDFDAAILIGVGAAHLPSLPPELLFFSRSVRADLGVPGAPEALREQHSDLAALMVRVPRVVATWRSQEGDEPRPLANWFTRLRAVAKAAGADPLRPDESGLLGVMPRPTHRPAPRAAHRLPVQITATQYQMLVDCPYQFYARNMLQLRVLDEISDEPQPTDFGKAVHEVLAAFHAQWNGQDLSAVRLEELATSLAAHAAAVFDPLVQRRPRLFALRGQFAETQTGYLAWVRRRAAKGWSFKAAESEARSPVVFEAAGATRTIELFGRLDRIDERGNDLEVLDYKTTRRDNLIERLKVAGEDVQLPFYGLLLTPRPTRAAFVYMQRTSNENQLPVDEVGLPQGTYALLVEALDARLRSDLARVAAGEALPALGNDKTCGYCKMRGLCRRDFWQDGSAAR